MTIDDNLIALAESLRAEHPEVLAHPQTIARLLCGVTSPYLTKAKLSSHALFGAAAHVRFPDVVEKFSAGINC